MELRKRKLQVFHEANIHSKKHSKPVIEKEPLNSSMDEFPVGCIVWSKLTGCPWWPAMIVDGMLCQMEETEPCERWVFWFGDHKVSKVPVNKLRPFKEDFTKKFKVLKLKLYRKAVEEAIKQYAEVLGYNVHEWNENQAMAWAEKGFPVCTIAAENKCTPGLRIPEHVRTKLQAIAENNKLKMKKKDKRSFCVKDIVDVKVNSGNQELFKKNKLKVNDICLGCMVSRKDCKNLENHPLFQGGICPDCLESLKTRFYSSEDTGEHLFCTVCSRVSNGAFKCRNLNCERTYCSICVEMYGKDSQLKSISSENSCILCTENNSSHHSKLCKHNNWRMNIFRMYSDPEREEDYPEINTSERGLRVLSLFDGIGTGLHVLHTLGLVVEKYYASEVEADAINVSRFNFKEKIEHVGDVCSILSSTLKEIGPIDLLIGGSPCNDLSFVNPLRKGLYGPDGSGVLFFEFYRVKTELEALFRDVHLYWMYENVTAMAPEFKKTISRFFRSEPVVIDAKDFSAQNRARLFWGNIPGIQNPIVSNAAPNLQDTLLQGFNRTASRLKLPTVTTVSNCMRHGKWSVVMDGNDDMVWLTELEKVFGFPQHYTDAGNLSLTKRRQLLGKAWSVQVVRHILKPLCTFFKVERPMGKGPVN